MNECQQLPAELGQLSALEELRLENNRLVELPRELGFLVHLKRLAVTGNPLQVYSHEFHSISPASHQRLAS